MLPYACLKMVGGCFFVCFPVKLQGRSLGLPNLLVQKGEPHFGGLSNLSKGAAINARFG